VISCTAALPAFALQNVGVAGRLGSNNDPRSFSVYVPGRLLAICARSTRYVDSFHMFVRYAAPVNMTPMCIAADADQRHPVFQPGQPERCRVLQASHAHSRAQWSWKDGEQHKLQRITGLSLL